MYETLDSNRFESLERVQTLADLFVALPRILDELDIAHAMLFRLEDPHCIVHLPILDVPPRLEDAVKAAVSSTTHPLFGVVGDCQRPWKLYPKQRNSGRLAASGELALLESAYRQCGFSHTYIVPLRGRNGDQYLFEVARRKKQITRAELFALQALLANLPNKLPFGSTEQSAFVVAGLDVA